VTREEILTTPAASQSLSDEAAKLVQKGAWDPKGVKEWQTVADGARKKGEKAHVGRIFGIVVEKHPELPTNHPDRKFKGRLVFQGNEVKDKNSRYAIFSELSRTSTPTGCFPGLPFRKPTENRPTYRHRSAGSGEG
jgi:hypothetical protein